MVLDQISGITADVPDLPQQDRAVVDRFGNIFIVEVEL